MKWWGVLRGFGEYMCEGIPAEYGRTLRKSLDLAETVGPGK